jgi:cell division protein FtsL
MISWLSAGAVKNLLLVGIVVGAAGSIYSMYRSVINLEVENKKMQMEAEQTANAVKAIGEQATMQANRVVVLNRKLRLADQTLAIAEARTRDRQLTEVVKKDPEKAGRALQEELNALFTEIETIANAGSVSTDTTIY